MSRPRSPHLDRFGRAAAGWLLLISGAAVFATLVLWPAYRSLADLQWQRGLLQTRLDRLQQQKRGYEQIESALHRGDSDLLLRLAYHELRVQPVGVRVIDAERPTGFDAPKTLPLSTIERWAHQPMPRVGVDYPQKPAVRSLLTRAADGPLRSAALLTALFCVMLGLWLPHMRSRRSG